LYELARSDVARINYTAFTQTLEDRITAVNLTEMGAALAAAAELVGPRERTAANRLRNQATILGAQQRVVDRMAGLVVSLRNATLSLEEHVRFNRTNVTEAVRELIEQAESAQVYLRTRGGSEVIQLADDYAAEFLSHLDAFSARLERGFRSGLGRCGPISTAYNSTAVTVCHNVVYPFNGFWASVGWCVLLFIPCVIVSLALTSLYRKTEPYSETYADMFGSSAPLSGPLPLESASGATRATCTRTTGTPGTARTPRRTRPSRRAASSSGRWAPAATPSPTLSPRRRPCGT